MACVAQDVRRLLCSPPAVLRGPQLCSPLRHCGTTPASASSRNPNAQAPRWIPTTPAEFWERLDAYRRQAKTPASVQQFAEAAGQGRLLRVLGIHSNNLWLRFGGILVAAGCAGGTYAVYKGGQSVYSVIMGVKESSWALNAIVRAIRSIACSPRLVLISCIPPCDCSRFSNVHVLQIGGAALGLAGYGAYRHQFVVSPMAVHRQALEALRRDPAVQEVLRLPLTPGKPVLSIVDGGQLHFKARPQMPAVSAPPGSWVTGLP